MNALPDVSTGGLTRGIWFVIPDGQDVLRVWGSFLTGKERIYLNDVCVHEGRSLGLESRYPVEIGGRDHEVILRVKSIMRGQLECRLQHADGVVAALVSKLTTSSWPRVFAVAAGCAVLSVVLEEVVGLPSWSYWVLFALAGAYMARTPEITVERLQE